jgi:hypothetical protein
VTIIPSFLSSSGNFTNLSFRIATAHWKLWKLRKTRLIGLNHLSIVRNTLIIIKSILSSTNRLRLIFTIIKSKIWIRWVSLLCILIFNRIIIALSRSLLLFSLRIKIGLLVVCILVFLFIILTEFLLFLLILV